MNVQSFPPPRAVNLRALRSGATPSHFYFLAPVMTTRMKGFFKGFKYISQIFVYKEHEMEIGYPTDVRHVAHIGWDSSPLNAPSWMNGFKTASDFSATSLGSFGLSRETSWASQDFDQAGGVQVTTTATTAGSGARPPAEVPKGSKKTKRKKTKQQAPNSKSKSSKTRAASLAAAHGDEGELRTEIG